MGMGKSIAQEIDQQPEGARKHCSNAEDRPRRKEYTYILSGERGSLIASMDRFVLYLDLGGMM